MVKSAVYIQFEEGFLKEAAEQGCNPEVLRGIIAETQSWMDKWAAVYDQIAQENNDPLFKQKIAYDLVELAKTADEGMLGGLMQSPMMQRVMQWAQENPQLFGGGSGGLIGLLLGALTGHPMMGAMIGGAGGYGLGALYNNGKLQEWMPGLFNHQSPATPEQEQVQQEPQSTTPAPVAKPEVTPQNNNQAVPGPKPAGPAPDPRAATMSAGSRAVPFHSPNSGVTQAPMQGAKTQMPNIQMPNPRPMNMKTNIPQAPGMIKTQSLKLADIMEGMSFSNSAPSMPGLSAGMTFQPQTTSKNPLLPNNAPVVTPPAQPLVTPGGSTITAKRPMKQVF